MSRVLRFQSFAALKEDRCQTSFRDPKKDMARRFSERTLCWLLVALAVLATSRGQVTFSRDWNPGKRSQSEPPCNAAFRSVEEVCKVLVDEFRQVAACEMRSLLRYQKEFEEKHSDMFLERPEGR